jgi:hypothetical protein
MAVVGWIAIAVLALIVLLGLIFATASLPDLRRYRRIRNM